MHYAEVALKGGNRPLFVKLLRRNIMRALAPLGSAEVTQRDGRFLVTSAADGESVASTLSKVFGVSWFAKAEVVEEGYGQMLAATERALSPTGGTFRVSVKRADKSFPSSSMDLERRLGADLVEATGMGVQLKQPGRTVYVDVLRGAAVVYSAKERGEGGLPVGSGGRVINLFSGGIDSPVAAWLMLKRGCVPVQLHFYLAPSPSDVLDSKVVRLVRALSAYAGRSSLVLVPFSEYQLATSGVRSDAEPSLFRRFMRLSAESLASRLGALAISTGDNLAQAASQTLWNLRSFDDGATLPVLRPLLTYDKEEIVQLAKRIGTYELSIEDYKDCCAIITRHPKTRADPAWIADLAEAHSFPGLVDRCLSLATVVTYDPAKKETNVRPLLGHGGPAEPELDREPGAPRPAAKAAEAVNDSQNY